MVFEITRPGRYTIPNWGRLDTSKPVNNERLLALYEDSGFPWITIIPGEEAVKFLKKQKLGVKRLAAIMLKAESEEEIETLLLVNDGKTLKAIAETRYKVLESKG